MAELTNIRQFTSYDNATLAELNESFELLGDNGSIEKNVPLGVLVQYFDATSAKIGKYFDTLFDNTDTSAATVISAYPTKPGIYRISNTIIPGTPISASNYGVLMIFNASGYYVHFFIDAASNLYVAFVSMLSQQVFVPTTWRKYTSTTEGVK